MTVYCRNCGCSIDSFLEEADFDAEDNTALHVRLEDCIAALKRSRAYAWNRPFDLATQEENARLTRENAELREQRKRLADKARRAVTEKAKAEKDAKEMYRMLNLANERTDLQNGQISLLMKEGNEHRKIIANYQDEVEGLYRKIETRNGTILKCASLLAELMQSKGKTE